MHSAIALKSKLYSISMGDKQKLCKRNHQVCLEKSEAPSILSTSCKRCFTQNFELYNKLWKTIFLPYKPQKYRWAVLMITGTFCLMAWTHCLWDITPCKKMQCSGKIVGTLNGEMMYRGRKRKRRMIFTLTKQTMTNYPYFQLLIPDSFKIQYRWWKFSCNQSCRIVRYWIRPTEYRNRHIFGHGSLRSPFQLSSCPKISHIWQPLFLYSIFQQDFLWNISTF